MHIALATPEDLPDLARLVWLHAADREQAQQPVDAFAADLAAWWADQGARHFAFLAQPAGSAEAVGVAWVALLPRVPRPGNRARLSADLQSVFVVPALRGQRIGSALVEAATAHARGLGAAQVTVHSSRRAVPVYERLGFGSSGQLLQLPPD